MDPITCKSLRTNKIAFMNKEFRQAIITNLRNMFLKSRSLTSKNAQNQQRNVCVSLQRKTIKQYYSK